MDIPNRRVYRAVHFGPGPRSRGSPERSGGEQCHGRFVLAARHRSQSARSSAHIMWDGPLVPAADRRQSVSLRERAGHSRFRVAGDFHALVGTRHPSRFTSAQRRIRFDCVCVLLRQEHNIRRGFFGGSCFLTSRRRMALRFLPRGNMSAKDDPHRDAATRARLTTSLYFSRIVPLLKKTPIEICWCREPQHTQLDYAWVCKVGLQSFQNFCFLTVQIPTRGHPAHHCCKCDDAESFFLSQNSHVNLNWKCRTD